MPLNRTPPSATKAVEPLNSPYYGGSEPNIAVCSRNNDEIEDFPTNITTRGPKRKYVHDCKEDMQTLKAEIKSMLSAWTNSQNNKIDQVLKSVHELREEYKEMRRTVDFIADKYDQINTKLNTTIASLEKEKKEQQRYILYLETKLENMERSLKSTTIEIRNIPKQKQTETSEDLINILKNVSNVLNVDIQSAGIRDIFRVNTKKKLQTTHRGIHE